MAYDYPEKPKNDERAVRSNAGMIRFVIFLVVGSVLMCGLSIGGFVYIMIRATQPVADASGEYLRAIRDGDYATAYDMLLPETQSQYETLQGYTAVMQEDFPAVETWRFNSRDINGIGTDSVATVMGSGRLNDGRSLPITVQLRFDGERWRIGSMYFGQ